MTGPLEVVEKRHGRGEKREYEHTDDGVECRHYVLTKGDEWRYTGSEVLDSVSIELGE